MDDLKPMDLTIKRKTARDKDYNGRVRIEKGKNEEFVCIKVHKGYSYDIPISTMQTAAQVLDWIHQVCVSKTWGPEITEEFLQVVFYDVIPVKMWSGAYYIRK